ncbi:MAG: protein kinase domain-containing protein, partial [Planctomycetota bacterium]
ASEPTVISKTPPREDPLIGVKVGGCQIQTKIGQGGMGAVYRGVQTSLDRPVAIKILPSHLAQNASYISRFLRESKIVASIRHPNIVSVYDRGNEGEIYFFVMEFIQGRTVGDVLVEKRTVQPGDAIEITRQAALALAAASAKNIIHRDIKPDNIMIDEGGLVKVTDFGLVKNTADTTGGITATHQVMGTPAFMSPEQCKGDPADHRSDIYSLGMTLYAMLAGKPAFMAETTHGLLMKQITEPPKPTHESNPNAPASIWSFLSKMLQKKPQDRFASWGEVIQEIDKLTAANPNDYVITGILQRSSGGEYQRVSSAPTTPMPGTPGQPTPVATPYGAQTFDLERSTPVPSGAMQPATQIQQGSSKGMVIGIAIGAVIALLAVVVILLLPKQGEKEPAPQTGVSTIIVGPPTAPNTGQGEVPEDDRSAEIKTAAEEIISDLELGDISKAAQKMGRLRSRFAGAKSPAARAALENAEKQFRDAEPLWRKLHRARADAKRMENAGNLAGARQILLDALKGISSEKMRGRLSSNLEAIEKEMQESFKEETSRAEGYMKSSAWDNAIRYWERAKKYAVSKTDTDLCENNIKVAEGKKAEIAGQRTKREKLEKLLKDTKAAYEKRDIGNAEKGIVELAKLRPGDAAIKELAHLIKLEKLAAIPAGVTEVSGRKLHLPAFGIGVYEVTNRQFRKFIDAGGYTTRKYWPGLAWMWKTRSGASSPKYWGDPKFNKPDQPVVGVSWYEAQAYCNWLGEKSGGKYRLPRLGEWQRAAEGPKNAKWPWGDSEKKPPANLRDAGPTRTGEVGKFADGKSGAGCFDIIGNVSEWCSLGFKHYAIGGSWLTYLEDVQADSRRPIKPSMRLNRLGFRVVREGK